MLLTVVCATPFEILPLRNFLEGDFETFHQHIYQKDQLQVEIVITGVGMVNTTYTMTKYLALKRPGLLINAGIAGALDAGLQIGEVVHVTAESYADFGVEHADGSFETAVEIGLIDGDAFPFSAGKLINPESGNFAFLPEVAGITVNLVHGSTTSIEALKKRLDAQVESMEGAAFFQVALQEEIPFIEIRSISNYVEPRNRDNWNIPLAIDNLNKVLIELVKTLANA